MDALDFHLERIAGATPDDWAQLLRFFMEQSHPWRTSELRLVRHRPLDDEDWLYSDEREWVIRMCERCWPSERSQRQ